MRIAACADLHIGFRQYQRLGPNGVNVRELDVSRTLTALIDRLITVAPDAIVIAGDVFHVPRPSNSAINHTFTEFKRLCVALPNAPIIIAAGNHDLARSMDAECALQLLTHLDICVADRQAKRFYFEALDLSVLAIPDAPGLTRPEIIPELTAKHNVLVMHGEVQGVTQGGADHRVSMHEVSREEIGIDSWDYVALGHYHQYEELAPNTFYSGSIDFTSTNPWQEIATPKGFVERNLVTGEHTFHELPASRAIVDLPRISAHEMSAEQLDEAIRERVESCDGGIDGKVVRLIVDGVSREIGRALDHRAINEFKRRALNLHLDLRRPEYVRGLTATRDPAKKRKSIDEMIIECFANPERTIPPDVDREAAVARAKEYLEQARDPYTNESYAAEIKEAKSTKAITAAA